MMLPVMSTGIPKMEGRWGERSNSKQIPKEGEKAVLGYFPIFPPVGGQGAAASP